MICWQHSSIQLVQLLFHFHIAQASYILKYVHKANLKFLYTYSFSISLVTEFCRLSLFMIFRFNPIFHKVFGLIYCNLSDSITMFTFHHLQFLQLSNIQVIYYAIPRSNLHFLLLFIMSRFVHLTWQSFKHIFSAVISLFSN